MGTDALFASGLNARVFLWKLNSLGEIGDLKKLMYSLATKMSLKRIVFLDFQSIITE